MISVKMRSNSFVYISILFRFYKGILQRSSECFADTNIYIYIYIIAEKLLTVFVMLINMNYLKAEIWQIGKKFGNRTCVKIVRMAFFYK